MNETTLNITKCSRRRLMEVAQELAASNRLFVSIIEKQERKIKRLRKCITGGKR